MKNSRDKCTRCGSQNTVIRGTQMVCRTCGQSKQSSHVFSNEYQKTQMRRTIKHIQERTAKERYSKAQEPIQTHLEKQWGEYLLGFQRYLIELATITQELFQLPNEYIDHVKKIWITQLTLWREEGRPMRSNWTIARRGHQQPLAQSNYVPNKYGDQDEFDFFEDIEIRMAKLPKLKYVFVDQIGLNQNRPTQTFPNTFPSTLDTELQMPTSDFDDSFTFDSKQRKSRSRSRSASNSCLDFVAMSKKRARKEAPPESAGKRKALTQKVVQPFYAKRNLKKQFLQVESNKEQQPKRRGSISRRKGSVTSQELQQFVETFKNNDAQDFLRSILKQDTQITDLHYQTIIEVYYEKHSSNNQNSVSGIRKQIKKIMHITSTGKQSRKVLLKAGFEKVEVDCLPPSYHKEAYLLREFLTLISPATEEYEGFRSIYEVLNKTAPLEQFDAKTIEYLLGKCDKLHQYLIQTIKKFQEDSLLTKAYNTKCRVRSTPKKLKPVTIDFYLIPTILIEASYVAGTPILLRDLYFSMRRGTIPFLAGFAKKMNPETCRTYLTEPYNVPSPAYVRLKICGRITNLCVPQLITEFGNRFQFGEEALLAALRINSLVKIRFQLQMQELFALAALLVGFQLCMVGKASPIEAQTRHLEQLIKDEQSLCAPVYHRDLKYTSVVSIIGSISCWIADNPQFETIRQHHDINTFFDRYEAPLGESVAAQPKQFTFASDPCYLYSVGDNTMYGRYLERLKSYLNEDIFHVLSYKKKIERQIFKQV